jgi:hypothetical protein
VKDIAFTFIASGTTSVDRKADTRVTWAYHQNAVLRLHEDTETWSCTKLGSERMTLNDLKRRLRYKFMAGAKAIARRKYVEQLDAERRAQELIGAKPLPVGNLIP